jgi:Peptidase family M1 domain
VTQVTRNFEARRLCWTLLLFTGIGAAHGQPASSSAVLNLKAQARETGSPKPAEALYLELRSVGLDPARTFHIRNASIDRSALHITLEDGEISFTRDIEGCVTGAFFQGDGEVLLMPPNQVERASMAMFTGMAILEERFATGYLRFNDDTFGDLKPYLRPAEDAQGFSTQWNETAHNLADSDALRLLATFSRHLPVAGNAGGAPDAESPPDMPLDRVLHARLQGLKLGTFDVYFDSLAQEPLWSGQAHTVDGVTYYDLWTSFSTVDKSRGGDPTGVARGGPVAISGYQIIADVQPPTSLSADARARIDVRRGGARTLFFELSRHLQVKQVEVNGQAVEFINNTAIDGTQLSKRGNDLVAVVFPAPLRAGQRLEVRFVYSGDVLSEAGGGLLYVGARGTWYPNRGLAMAEFSLEFHYPAGWSLVATGKRAPPADGDGSSRDSTSAPAASTSQIAHWVTERPSTLAGFNLGRYVRATASADGVAVEAYAAKAMERSFPRAPEELVEVPQIGPKRPEVAPLVRQPAPPSPARNAQAVADRAARAVTFFSSRFGPYPYSSLSLTQMPGRVSQGWPGLVFLSSFAFLTPDEEAELRLDPVQTIFSGLALEHETAHQWWGDLVGWRSYRDQWIVEALANYSALMMLEAERPVDFRKAMDKYQTDLLEKNKQGQLPADAGPVTLGLRLNSSRFPGGYEAISYGRGTWLMHMLRHMLLNAESQERQRSGKSGTSGEEPFLKLLRHLRDRFAGKEISTEEFIAVLEEGLPPSLWYEGQRSLDWFFKGWVQGVAVPHFGLQSVKYVSKTGHTLVTGSITQTGGPPDLVTPVPVYAVVAGKTASLGTVFVDGPEVAFHLTAPPGTRKIVVDPYQTLLTSQK